MRGNSSQVVIITLTLFGILFFLFPLNAEAVGTINITLDIQKGYEERYVDVSPDSKRQVDFPCSATVEGMVGEVQDMVMNITARSENNWPVLVQPEQLMAYEDQTRYFTITVTAPPEESANVVDTVTISGTAHLDPGNRSESIEPITATTIVEQFFSYEIEPWITVIRTEPGKSEIFNIRILNKGNGEDTFRLYIHNLDQIEKLGINVSLESYEIKIDEKSSRDFQGVVSIPDQDKLVGDHNIKIAIETLGRINQTGTNIFYVVVVTLEVEGTNILDIIISPTIGPFIIILIIAVTLIVIYRRRKDKRSL